MLLDISIRLRLEVTTIIFHHMKKSIIKRRKNKKNTKIWGLDKNSYVNKNDT